jgi:predicted ATPase/DNA-binding XRE family transcriptional regulator
MAANEENLSPYFSEWLKSRRQELDLTQAELAERAYCSVFTLRKIEAGERRPSKQLAEQLAQSLGIPAPDRATFIKVARGELGMERLGCLAGDSRPTLPSRPAYSNLPRALTPFIGREPELAALSQLLQDPGCALLTIVGPGGIGKTRLAIELASNQQASFPGGVYYASLDSIDSPSFIVPAIAQSFGLSLSGADDPQKQLLNHLAGRDGQAFLLLLDNLEHLLLPTSEAKEDLFRLLPALLENASGLKILATSRERVNLREEWVFELHGLPVPTHAETERLEDYSAVALFLQRARQLKVNFQILPEQRPALIRICQLVEGTPLAIELSATWVNALSLQEIAQEIAADLDFLTNRIRNIPERHRSLRAVFEHSWKLLSPEEREVLCRLAIFRGGFQRQAAEQVAGASLPILISLLSKSFLLRREDTRYDLHALIRQCGLEKLQESGQLEATSDQHLAYFVSFALEAHQGLRSAQQPDWFRRIEKEHNNIRAALEWAFRPGAPSERVEEGLSLAVSIDRFWPGHGHIREGITWFERALQASQSISLDRARALRIAGWLYAHEDNEQHAILLLEESVAIAKQLNDDNRQADGLDTLGDVAWRFGDFEKARDYYAESLALYRKGANPLNIALSLASAGRLHVDYGRLPEAEILLLEGLSFLDKTPDLRGRAYCLNALGRLALFQDQLKLAAERFRQALCLNQKLGYMVDLSECLHSLAVVEAIAGEEDRATVLRAAATALQKKTGFIFPINDPLFLKAPDAWSRTAPLSKEWQAGEKMSPDQAVAYALEHEVE